MAGSVTIQQRVEDKWFLTTLGRLRRSIRSVGRIEHARLSRPRGVRIRRRGRLRRRVRARRQVERTFASTAAQRQRRYAQQDDGPSRRSRAVVTDHDEIPNKRPHLTKIALLWRELTVSR